MLLLEHHGKALLRKGGIATPRGVMVAGATELEAAWRQLPPRLVLKAQVPAGGRGKSGGIVFARAEDDLSVIFNELRTRTVGGYPVEAVLVEEQIDYVRERFIALAVEDGCLRLMLGRDGGIDVEDLAANDADSMAVVEIDPIDGPAALEITDCLVRLGIPLSFHDEYCDVAFKLFQLAAKHDARLVEINPLVELPNGGILALDAKVDIDDDALPRHPEFAIQPTVRQTASRNLLQFKRNPEAGGTIGVIGLGGGLNVTIMDWIHSLGGRVATLVDMDPAIGAGRAQEGFQTAFDSFDSDPCIRAILINIVTCGYRLDEIVSALIKPLAERAGKGAKPVVLHLRGNSMSLTPQMLSSISHVNSASIADAVAVVVEAGRA